MSKIDEFNAAKATATEVEEKISIVIAPNSFGKRSEFEILNTNVVTGVRGEGVVLHLIAQRIVTYASDEFISCHGGKVTDYLVKAINNHLYELAHEAITLAKDDAERARREAINEAKVVMGEVMTQEVLTELLLTRPTAGEVVSECALEELPF